ncbi:TIGR02569 family protein [Streptomyces sp. N2-109]|uniref:TIGR02569 family protein n=1 Tax=Streptomyces gossypii TaxID=2883101 RepID=A0ABT2JQY7_9ACTN|nr:TIGR02569 family protein [Streptomyces gossypii]MCT2590171.1 TIGR02569 family protein [Streptomyces gossypii]
MTLSTADVGLPPSAVVAAFGLTGRPVRLSGGQGHSVRVGDAVLKPAEGGDESEWAARLVEGLRQGEGHGFRVPRPLCSVGGKYVVEGWAASRFVSGAPRPAGDWAALLNAGRAFHRALRQAPRPRLLDARRHPWAVADRVAWGGRSRLAPAGGVPSEARRLLLRILSLRQPVEAPCQLVHGDLTGNVLFAAGQVPAVIDFSPYWRPVAYADAIVAVDGTLYHGAGPELLERAAPGAEGAQLLVRALAFRLAVLVRQPEPGAASSAADEVAGDELARFARVTELVQERIDAGRQRRTR